MSVKKYCINFKQLSRYSPNTMANPRSGISKFITGVSSLVVKECRNAMLIGDMDLARMMIHA